MKEQIKFNAEKLTHSSTSQVTLYVFIQSNVKELIQFSEDDAKLKVSRY